VKNNSFLISEQLDGARTRRSQSVGPFRAGFPRLLVAVLMATLPIARAGYAARPMVTDDARIVDGKACQLESWINKYEDSTEAWALPACNFTGNLELTLGGTTTPESVGAETTGIVMQGKTLFREMEVNGWGSGFAAGTILRPVADTRDWYVYLLNSFSFRDDAVVVHTNLGWLRPGETRDNRMTWGVGTELLVVQRTWLMAETFGQNQGKPFHQFGLRHWVVQDHVQLDATYGNRNDFENGERWFSIGIRLISVPLLP
jgi:hypothetical protein